MTTIKTSLYESHTKLGAKMVPFAGFEMPIQYTSVKDEALSVRNNVGIFDVSHMGEFFVEGIDAHLFIDEMITNDFLGAENLKAVYSPLCREDGTTIDDLIAYKLSGDKALICVNASNIDKDFDWLNSFIKNYNCTLTNESNDYSLVAIQGPKSEELLKQLNINSKLDNFSYYSVLTGHFQNHAVIIARTGYTGEDGFEVFIKNEGITDLWNACLEHGATPCGLAARDVLRLEVCYPLYGHELTDSITPLDSGLKWTVRPSKNKFIGKNILAELKPSYRLVKLSLDKGIPRESYPIFDGDNNEIGVVTSGTMSVTINKGIALGLIEKNKFPQDKKFFISIRNKLFKANYHTKPFITGGHK